MELTTYFATSNPMSTSVWLKLIGHEQAKECIWIENLSIRYGAIRLSIFPILTTY